MHERYIFNKRINATHFSIYFSFFSTSKTILTDSKNEQRLTNKHNNLNLDTSP